jgi:predicted amidophosphoribosyltransferase
MAIQLKGNWKKGFAFDLHTLESTYLGVDERGHDRWDNTRSEMGQLVYDLKYGNDPKAAEKIVKLLDSLKFIDEADTIVPIPPSNASRRLQPVVAIARELGKRRGITVLEDVLRKKAGSAQLKNVEDPDERSELLRKSLIVSRGADVAGRKVLLLDDLYRSGATLSVATELLLKEGGAKSVCALTMTKTRSKR